MEIATYSEQFTSDIEVAIRSETEDHFIIVLASQSGRILRMMGVNLTLGENRIHFDDVETLDAGIYQLTVKNANSLVLYSSMLTKF